MITSTKSKTVKQWVKLHKKKYRQQLKQFLLEGYHLVEEAVKSEWEIETIILRVGEDEKNWRDICRVEIVSEQVFSALSHTLTPQGIIAVVKLKDITLTKTEKLLVLDNVQDPGNVGTMIRSADAFNYDGVILGLGTADLYHDKVVRATQGSLFHLPVVTEDLTIFLPKLKDKGVKMIAATLTDAVALDTVKKTDAAAIIVGNEGSGVTNEIINISDLRVNIPITGEAESLNVAVAAGILLYHFK